MELVAEVVQSVVLAGSGHWVAEQAPDELLAAVTAFLAHIGRRRSLPQEFASSLDERRRTREVPPELSGFVRMWGTALTRSGDSENVVPGSFAASP
jgi:hypothetical protein